MNLVLFLVLVLLGTTYGSYVSRNADGSKNRRMVCGTNGVTYKNICQFLGATCRPDDREMDTVFPMTKLPHHACAKVTISWERRKIKNCYIDFLTKKTYTHQDCEVRKMQCNSDSKMLNRIYLHPGECGKCSMATLCPWMPPKGKQSELFHKRCAVTSSTDIPKCAFGQDNIFERCCCFITRCTAFRKDMIGTDK